MFKLPTITPATQKILIQVGAGVGVFGAGCFAGYQLAKHMAKKKAKAAQKPVVEQKTATTEGKEEKSEPKESNDSSDSDLSVPGEIIRQLGYSVTGYEDPLANDLDDEEDPDDGEDDIDDDDYRQSSLPYRISSSGFGSDPFYKPRVIKYWGKDHVFSDEWDEPVDDPDRLFGILDDDFYDISPDEFNESWYIRNESLGEDYNIVRQYGSYTDSVFHDDVY